jgi:hypothetical protein
MACTEMIDWECSNEIGVFLQGMVLPPQLTISGGNVVFNGTGVFTGILGHDCFTMMTEYPLKRIKQFPIA